MAPFASALHPGTVSAFAAFFLIGMGFGAVLEMSGFGDSRRLAAQFYMRDMTVLKVMFTGIIVAAVLLQIASALQWLDMSRVWVNPTYLWPGIVGGLIMGVGFIVGGFCPGTSVVAASTLKLDGVVFLLGVGTGVYAFGKTVRSFEGFFNSSSMGRFTLGDWLGVPSGLAALLLVLMALAMFYGAEISEAVFGRGRSWKDVRLVPRNRWLASGAGLLVLLAATSLFIGQPDARDRYRWIAPTAERQVSGREVFVDPAEVVDLSRDLTVAVRIFEIRTESDYNLFHLEGSRRISPSLVSTPGFLRELQAAAENTVFFLASNDEKAATEAWRVLRAQGVLNLYVIDGGINGWLERYPVGSCIARRLALTGNAAPDTFAYEFQLAVGDRNPSAHPARERREFVPDCGGATELAASRWGGPPSDYLKKVKLQRKVVAKGGCG